MANINGTQYDDTIKLSGSFYYQNGKKSGSKSNATPYDDVIQTGSGNDYVEAGGGNDRISGGNGNDTLHGQAGNDEIWGDSFGNPDANDNGQDLLYGGAGLDILHGGNGKDFLNGGTEDDQLFGENGVDVLFGDSGNDKLTGGLGGDFLRGGTGADMFIITTNTGSAVADSPYLLGAPGVVSYTGETTVWSKNWDVLSDFSGTAGEGDKIDLSQLDSYLPSGVDLVWRAPIGTDADAGAATPGLAYGVWTDTGGNFLYADITGDGKADMKVQVQGVGSGDLIGVTLDTTAPTVTVNIVDTILTDNDNQSVVTFTFSEHVLGFTEADITTENGHIVAGSLSTSDGGKTWSATFEADDGFEGTGKVEVTNASYTDYSANPGSGGSDTVTIDTLNPTVTINILDTLLWDGDNSSDVTITFSEDVSGFVEGDLVVTGGTLSNFTQVDGSHWTATFTAADGYDSDDDGAAGISLAGSAYTDLNGNAGENGGDTVDVDTKNPTVTINIVDASLNDGDNQSNVTITFSEDVSGFALGDLVVTGGTLSNFVMVDASHYTATFTASQDYDSDDDGAAGISLAGSAYTDLVGNAGTNGGDAVDVDTRNPTVVSITFDDTLLTDGTPSTTVTIVFSEAVNLAAADIDPDGGTISDLGTADGGLTWTATFNATDGYDSNDGAAPDGAGITVLGTYTDLAGNIGTGDSGSVEVDTLNPTLVSIVFADSSLSDANDSSNVTITFSEAVGDINSYLTPSNGTLGTFTSGDGGVTWTGTFTASQDTEGNGSITVGNGYADLNGNTGTGGDGGASIPIDTRNPTVVIDIVDASLNDGDNSSDVTITFSEAVTGFDQGDLTVTGGLLSGFTTSDNITWTATFTANDGFDGEGKVDLTGAYTDLAGNAGTGDDDTVTIDTLNPTLVSIVFADSLLWDGDDTSSVTITFSEAVDNFDGSDLTPTNGTLGTFTSGDGGLTWTGTFTASQNTEGTGSITVGNGFTDLVGNTGTGGNGGGSVAVDTKNPTVTVNIVAATLNDATPSSTVTFVFSEAVTGFTAADISFTHGTVTGLTTSDNISWTATYMADDGYDGPGEVSVAADSYTDAAGNLGSGGSDTVTIDRFEAAPAVADIKFVPNSSDFDGGTVTGAVGSFVAFDAAGNVISGLTFTSNLSSLTLSMNSAGLLTANTPTGAIEFDVTVGGVTEHVYFQVGANSGPGDNMPGSGADPTDMMILIGLNGGDSQSGGTNDDTLYGGGSAGQTDNITGGLGDDYLIGGVGDDNLTGGGGADWFRGGAGADNYLYSSASDSLPALRDIISDFNAAEDDIDLSGIDAITGGANDAFLGLANSTSTTPNSLNWYQDGGNTFLAGDVNGDTTPDFVIQLTGLHTLDANSGGNVVL